MAKIALLIGISDYGEGLPQLPGTKADLQTMQQVLKNTQVGAFDQVDVLANPNRTEMETAIETLFSKDRSKDDLILLYFSGHGILDDQQTLYLAAANTRKLDQRRILTSTAVESTVLQRYMSRSRSKRQVLILDCCFAGAFANNMKAKSNETIDIEGQLGSEGRAVLTSSSEAQLSYEIDGASIYTRYLVQGLATGAADQDEDGRVTVNELHEYAKEKVQESSPSMQPEIYAAREGHKIVIARAPQGDPKLLYRKELNERVKQKQGKLSRIDQRALKFRWQELGLTVVEAEQIADEILQPYEEFRQKLKEFEQAVAEAQEDNPDWTQEVVDDLRYFQQMLKLRDKDIAPVLERQRVSFIKSLTSMATPVPEVISLESESGVDYAKLRDLLAAGDWQGADYETYLRMLEAVGRDGGDFIRDEELLHFPSTDLKTIDRLWVHYSQGHFGFSVQKEIYADCGARLNGEYPGDEVWHEFCRRIGWRVKDRFISYSCVMFDTKSRKAHLPVGFVGVVGYVCVWLGGVCWSLLSHKDL